MLRFRVKGVFTVLQVLRYYQPRSSGSSWHMLPRGIVRRSSQILFEGCEGTINNFVVHQGVHTKAHEEIRLHSVSGLVSLHGSRDNSARVAT